MTTLRRLMIPTVLLLIVSMLAVPAFAAWLSLLTLCALCVLLLYRKVRAYEIVR